MRFRCYGCGNSVSSEVPEDAILRAIAWCPECLQAEKDQDPEILAATRQKERERCVSIPLPDWPCPKILDEEVGRVKAYINGLIDGWCAHENAIRALDEPAEARKGEGDD